MNGNPEFVAYKLNLFVLEIRQVRCVVAGIVPVIEPGPLRMKACIEYFDSLMQSIRLPDPHPVLTGKTHAIGDHHIDGLRSRRGRLGMRCDMRRKYRDRCRQDWVYRRDKIGLALVVKTRQQI